MDEEVLACATGVCDTILVYDRNIQYVRTIQQNGGSRFYDISADNQHNLFVADNNIIAFSIDSNNRVQCF